MIVFYVFHIFYFGVFKSDFVDKKVPYFSLKMLKIEWENVRIL